MSGYDPKRTWVAQSKRTRRLDRRLFFWMSARSRACHRGYVSVADMKIEIEISSILQFRSVLHTSGISAQHSDVFLITSVLENEERSMRWVPSHPNSGGADDKSGGPNAWKLLCYRQGGFVHSFQSYRRPPVFDATVNEISAREPPGPLGKSSSPRLATQQ